MKKFIVDKTSIDQFIRTVEDQSRFTFSRKINRDLMAAMTEVIGNCLANYEKTFKAKVNGKIEYLITLSTKEKLKTIDIVVSNPLTAQTICQEHYLMPTQTLSPYTYNEIANYISAQTPLFTKDQLDLLIQTSVTKNSAIASATAGVSIITDFQNEVLTCNMFNDEAIVNTFNFFIPKESIELGFNPTLYRYLSVDFDQYTNAVHANKTLNYPESIDTLITQIAQWGECDEAVVTKLLLKLLYNAFYTVEGIQAVLTDGIIPEIVFILESKRYVAHLNKTHISEIVSKSGDKYKTALRNSLLESSRKSPVETKPTDMFIGINNEQPEGRTSLIETKGKKREPRRIDITNGTPTFPKMNPVFQPSASQTEKKLTDYNVQSLLETLKHIDTPQDAYDEIIKFIGDEVEFKGKITHKDMLVIYHFSHDNTATNEVETGLKIDIKINRLNLDNPSQVKKLFCFTVDAKREDVGLISGAFSYLKNMFN